MIKKITILMASVMACLAMVAQPALQRGAESKALDMDDLMKGRYIGRSERADVWVMEGRRHVKQVVRMDLNMQSVQSTPLAKSGDLQVLAATLDDEGDASVLLADQSDNRHSRVLAARTVREGYDTLLNWEHGRRDNCMLWGASSPSGDRLAFVAVLQLNETKQYRTWIAVYDQKLQLLWEREFALGSLSDVMVTDSGRVVTLGIEEDEVETHFIFNTMDAHGASSYDATVKCDPIREVHLASVVGPVAVAAGTYMPTGMRKADRYTAGVIGLAFDLDVAELKGVTMRPFQNEDMNVFLNKKTKKIQRSQVMDHVKTLATMPTGYGAVVALSHQRLEETSEEGGTRRDGYSVGVHLVAVDTTGHVRWVRNVRRMAHQKGGDDQLKVGLASMGDRICMVMNESAKEPTVYDIANAGREVEPGDKGNIVVYTMDEDGTTNKLLLEVKSKQTVMRALPSADGSLLYYTLRGSKCRAAELKF